MSRFYAPYSKEELEGKGWTLLDEYCSIWRNFEYDHRNVQVRIAVARDGRTGSWHEKVGGPSFYRHYNLQDAIEYAEALFG